MSEQIFADAFDDALRQRFAAARREFLLHRGRYFSDETDATLTAKLALVRDRIAQGRSLSEACDDPDVYLGWLDREYLGYRLRCDEFDRTPIDLDTFHRSHAYREAADHIRRSGLCERSVYA